MQFLERHPDLAGIVCCNMSNPVGAARAVIEAGERESGITIHWVNERYDSGDTIFQATVAVDADDTAETLAANIHVLEHRHFPTVIEETIAGLPPIDTKQNTK